MIVGVIRGGRYISGAETTSETRATNGYPRKSTAMAVHPSQLEEAAESAKRKGVPTDFAATGEPIFTSRAHQKKYITAYGYRNKDGGYED